MTKDEFLFEEMDKFFKNLSYEEKETLEAMIKGWRLGQKWKRELELEEQDNNQKNTEYVS